MKTRILFSSGGTGGHIFPAIAVAEQIRLLDPQVALLFIGSKKGPEGAAAKAANIPFKGLAVQGVLGKGFGSLKALGCMVRETFNARKLIRDFKPDVALGFGAYATVPPLLVSYFYKVPIALHEQNAMPGLSNRLLSYLATKIFTSIPQANEYFSESKVLLCGNPVRTSILELATRTQSPRDQKRLFIMGGSQGAKAVNSLIIANLERFIEAGIQLTHQTGASDFERVRAAYAARGLATNTVTPFIDDMATAYSSADMVLGRAGASSVAELAVSGTPAMLIPFPAATHDHQTHNAAALVNAGAALMIAERDLNHYDVTHTLITLLNDPATLVRMSQLAQHCSHPDAARLVAQAALALCHVDTNPQKGQA